MFSTHLFVARNRISNANRSDKVASTVFRHLMDGAVGDIRGLGERGFSRPMLGEGFFLFGEV